MLAGYPVVDVKVTDANALRTPDLLDAENAAGIKLTESYAMWPGASALTISTSMLLANVGAPVRAVVSRVLSAAGS